MRGLFLAATIGLLTLAASAAPGGPPAQNSSAQNQGTERLNEETNARLRQQIEERERILQRNRETRERIRLENERAQREYQEQLRAREQEQQRYNAEMERFRAQQATRGAGNTSRTETARETAPTRRVDANRARQSNASADTCQDQRQRARRRGRGVGGVLGGVAGVLGGRNLGNAARIGLAVASVPIGALIGEAIASRLDCREQQQAAVATEQVTDQAAERGVGATVAWQSETRPNVTGTTTVTALSTPTAAAADACMTVTDVIIVDGEETRAEKRMCRRPPTNRFVRV
jgi:surface antigen